MNDDESANSTQVGRRYIYLHRFVVTCGSSDHSLFNNNFISYNTNLLTSYTNILLLLRDQKIYRFNYRQTDQCILHSADNELLPIGCYYN